MTKVIKLALICEQCNKDGALIDYNEIYKILWELQRQTREIKNKSIPYCWEYNNFSSDYYRKNNAYPNEKDILSYTLVGYVNDKLKKGNDLYSGNCSTTVRGACGEFKTSKEDIFNGLKSIINYKENQPLDLHNKTISIEYVKGHFYVYLKLLNREATKKYNFSNSEIKFKILVKDNSTKVILQRCIDSIYSISASKLLYNKKKKLWMLNLCYSFDNHSVSTLDPNKILGVDLGVHYPICASVYGDLNRFTIDGGEIEEYRKRIESRKKSLLKQAKNCGDGRIGHGIKTRNKPVYNIKDKIAKFRDTTNHKYSRSLVNFAIKNNCGIIQMEELTGIANQSDRFLKNWPYYDLQSKIEYKAKEARIKVEYIDPHYTSQRCSKCGYISSDNRKTQSRFCCQKCEFEENADYNASQNIAIKGIDNLINNDE